MGGLVLLLLSALLLLVGGGFGPPLLGLILAIAATRINVPLTWWQKHRTQGLQQVVERTWPWLYGFCLISWLMLLPGLSILSYAVGMSNPDVVLAVTLLAFGTLMLTLLLGWLCDSRGNAAETPPLAAPRVGGSLVRR
jgi:hypothetical protein